MIQEGPTVPYKAVGSSSGALGSLAVDCAREGLAVPGGGDTVLPAVVVGNDGANLQREPETTDR